MAKIFAAGIYDGVPLRVLCEGADGDRQFLFNGETDEILEGLFHILLEKSYPVGGSYYPPEDSMMNVYALLSGHFFDGPRPFLSVEGDIGRIPLVPGEDDQ